MEDLESISKEQVIAILQNKSKELKQIQNKLQKLEEKYIKIYKENKLHNQDRLVIDEFFTQNFKNFQKQNIGDLDKEVLQSHLDDLEKNIVKIPNDQIQEKQREINELNTINQEYKQNEIKYVTQLKDTKNQNFFLNKDLEEILLQNQKNIDLIDHQNQQITDLKIIEQEYHQLKSQDLIEGIKTEQNQMDVQQNLQENQFKDKFLKTQDLLEEANLKIGILENQQNNQKHILYNFKNQRETTDQEIQTSPLICQQCEALFLKLQEYESKINKVPLDKEYLKQVIYKYLICIENKNYSQAQVLQHVLIDLVKLDQSQIQSIELARKQGSIWSSTKQLIMEARNKNDQK